MRVDEVLPTQYLYYEHWPHPEFTGPVIFNTPLNVLLSTEQWIPLPGYDPDMEMDIGL